MSKLSSMTHAKSNSLHEQINRTYHQFNIERDAKNAAYAFILHRGLFEEFREFNEEVRIRNLSPFDLAFSKVKPHWLDEEPEENNG